MKPYHKIPTVWERDPATKHRTLVEGRWATPELAALAALDWLWTEKVDGTNIRVGWDGERVTFGGRTDNAQIPAHLVNRLHELFEDLSSLRELGAPVTLYGEGYGAKIQKGGAKIQKGGDYIPDGCGFILFDAMIGEWLLQWTDVQDVAKKLGIPSVPVVGIGSLGLAVTAVRESERPLYSQCAKDERLAEGLVMRPVVDLFDRKGNRIIAKVKAKDFR